MPPAVPRHRRAHWRCVTVRLHSMCSVAGHGTLTADGSCEAAVAVPRRAPRPVEAQMQRHTSASGGQAKCGRWCCPPHGRTVFPERYVGRWTRRREKAEPASLGQALWEQVPGAAGRGGRGSARRASPQLLEPPSWAVSQASSGVPEPAKTFNLDRAAPKALEGLDIPRICYSAF